MRGMAADYIQHVCCTYTGKCPRAVFQCQHTWLRLLYFRGLLETVLWRRETRRQWQLLLLAVQKASGQAYVFVDIYMYVCMHAHVHVCTWCDKHINFHHYIHPNLDESHRAVPIRPFRDFAAVLYTPMSKSTYAKFYIHASWIIGTHYGASAWPFCA